MRFGVLGPLAVWTDEGTAVQVPGVKVRTLLADLLAHAGRPVSADRLVADLWGEEPPANPAGALQAKVSQLRRSLEDAEPGGRALVEWRTPGYLLRVESSHVDAGRFARITAQARDSGAPRARTALLTDALELFRGPAYADFADAEFARTEIARLEEQRTTALEDLADARLELGEYRPLAGELDALVEQHPLRERLRGAHIRALYQSGRQSDALASYERMRVRLRTELGADPGPELVRLHQAVLQQDPALRPDPPHQAAARPRTNLPAPLLADGGLVGRDGDTADVRTRLAAGRLVTLTGPGGVGKTRLAVETAARAAEDFPGGTWLVELAAHHPTDTAQALAGAVLAALGIREDAGVGAAAGREYTGPLDRLTAALQAERPLLILDNCEHVVEAAAELAQVLLAAAPHVHILATAQEPLGITGELLYPVPPLQLPDPDADVHAMEHTPAVRLFVDRTAAAAPGFALDPDNAAAVASICRRLDGIPLALELAATRVRSLGVRELAARLDDRFRILTAGNRDAPARQRTLRAMIDWSWEPLPEPERAVLRRLAVHADGCTLEAAEDVCSGGEVAAADVLDLLSRLVDRSLVVAETAPGTRAGGGAEHGTAARPSPRYRLLESVAAYCLERADEAGETDAVRHRHAHYYTRLAEQARPRLRGSGQHAWLERMDTESANMRAALDTAVRLGAASVALRLVNALAWYLILRGRYGQACESLRAALELPGAPAGPDRAAALSWLAALGFTTLGGADADERARDALEAYDRLDDPDGRAHAQWLLAFARQGSGDLAGSEKLVEQALSTFRARGNRWGIAAARSTRAETALARGCLAAARRDSEAAESLFQEVGDRWGQVQATRTRGLLAEIAGDYDAAERAHRSVLGLAEELKLWPLVSVQTAALGRLALLAGDVDDADELHEQARLLAAEQGDGSGEAFAATGLALGARRRGRLDTAEAHLRRLLAWNRRTGYQPGTALVLAELGFVAEQRGDAGAAAALHAEGLAVARETGNPRAVALALEGTAGAAALAGDHRRAAHLLGEATAARASADAPLPGAERGDVDRISAASRRAIGGAEFDAAFARGSGAE
ncbi:BTAD domain-containing putative transcriptional regulator [Streptomonospora salina]|uniref:Putative ATPase/DNA-binding SARP family transcriptional activator n=1 Tax=Streptomonospora salina TaxID=104205 RepID=A0A841E7P8_9ACTN|nr:BTAD domain-containing putative transcriptional regulator [Streptomonospora salina]MBB5996580.1 putative ATPase/DNA-binding SARP family transcriptional activator [Streptomonospora salina]